MLLFHLAFILLKSTHPTPGEILHHRVKFRNVNALHLFHLSQVQCHLHLLHHQPNHHVEANLELLAEMDGLDADCLNGAQVRKGGH